SAGSPPIGSGLPAPPHAPDFPVAGSPPGSARRPYPGSARTLLSFFRWNDSELSDFLQRIPSLASGDPHSHSRAPLQSRDSLHEHPYNRHAPCHGSTPLGMSALDVRRLRRVGARSLVAGRHLDPGGGRRPAPRWFARIRL